MVAVVHVVRGIVVAVVARVGVVRVRRVVGVRVGRVRHGRVAVALPTGARTVLCVRLPAILAVIAAVHICLRLRSRQRARPCSSATAHTYTHRTHALYFSYYRTFRSEYKKIIFII